MAFPSRRTKAGIQSRNWSIAAALFGAALLLAWVLPPAWWAQVPFQCPFLRVTGRPCPTCGLTRSWAALLHGDLGGSLAFHAAGPLLALGLLAFLTVWAMRGARPRLSKPWSFALGGLWAAYAVGRMAGVLPGP